MSGHPQGHYDDGYGHHQPQGTDSYYQDDHTQGYYDQAEYGHDNGGYYDEAFVKTAKERSQDADIFQWLL